VAVLSTFVKQIANGLFQVKHFQQFQPYLLAKSASSAVVYPGNGADALY